MSVAADRAVGLTLAALSADAESDHLVEQLQRGILGPLEDLSHVAHDGDYPWQTLTDPGVASLKHLPHAALWTGGVMPPRLAGESDADYLARSRTEVVQPRGMRRGAPGAIKRVAQAYLTGTKTSVLVPKVGGSLWNHLLLVWPSECPDQAALEDAINAPSVVPAGMRFTVDELTVDSWLIARMEDEFDGLDLADLEAAFASIDDLEANTRI